MLYCACVINASGGQLKRIDLPAFLFEKFWCEHFPLHLSSFCIQATAWFGHCRSNHCWKKLIYPRTLSAWPHLCTMVETNKMKQYRSHRRTARKQVLIVGVVTILCYMTVNLTLKGGIGSNGEQKHHEPGNWILTSRTLYLSKLFV